MSQAVQRFKGAGRGRRWWVLGVVACVVAIVWSVVAVTSGGGGPHRTPAQSSGADATHTAGQSNSATTSGGASTSIGAIADQSPGLPICATPGSSAQRGGWSLVATTRGAIPRYASPGNPQDGTIPGTWYGGASSLPVIAQQPGWVQVRLATRPNGSTAWVHQADVTLAATPYWISVNLATRHVALVRLDREVMDVPAGVGTGEDPTPTGQYFVAFFEASPSAGYGPFVIVTSAHSTAIANWEGSGDAVIGIHGPLGADSLIGTSGAYLSHGCIRIPIPDLVHLRDVPAGSPISICG